MNLRKFFMIAAMLLFASTARALDPKTLETDWDWDLYFKACTGAATCTADVMGLGQNGSSMTANGVGFAYHVYSKSGDATFTISHTTKTYSALAGNSNEFNSVHPGNLYSASLAPCISTSTAITVPQNVMLDGKFEALTINPVFTFSGLTTTATTYLYVEYGTPKNVK